MHRLQLIPQLSQPGKGATCHILVPARGHGHKALHTNSLKFRKLAGNSTNLIGRKAALGLLAAYVNLDQHLLGGGELASFDLANGTARDRLRQMKRPHRMNQLGRAQHRVDLVGLKVANHVEAHLGQLRMIRQTCKFADELLRAVLGKMAISHLDGRDGLIDADGLGHGNQTRGITGPPGAIERGIETLEYLLAASAHYIQIVIHCQSPPLTAQQVVPC